MSSQFNPSVIPDGRVWKELGNQWVLLEAVYFDDVCVREGRGKRSVQNQRLRAYNPTHITSAQTHGQDHQLQPGVLHQMVLLVSQSAQRQPEGDQSRREEGAARFSTLHTSVHLD